MTRPMTDAQEQAYLFHKLDGLARVHCGKLAAVSYDSASGAFTVEAGGAVLVRGTYQEAIDVLTLGREAAR